MSKSIEIQRLSDLSSQFMKEPLGKMMDFDVDQLTTLAFISKWRPLLNEYGSEHLDEDPKLIAQWVWLVFAEYEINLEDHQH